MTARDDDLARAFAVAGRQLAITWTIPERFGGMTAAMLRRSRAFAELAGAPVEVLVFDPRVRLSEARARAERADPGEGVRIRSLHAWLRAVGRAPEPGTLPPGDLEPDGDGDVRELRRDGRVVGFEVLRADGSVAAVDERRPDGRRITALDAEGRVWREWRGAWPLYEDWILALTRGAPATAIVDSKTMARFAAHARVPGLARVHVVHNSHLAGTARPVAPLRRSRRDVFANLERFDAVVFLTERQRADAAALLTDPGTLAVVPNAVTLPARAIAAAPRDPARGVVVAGLTKRKRLGHALDVVRRLRADGLPARLDVIGAGPELASLRRRVDDLGLGDAVTFVGHRDDAADAFAAAGWTLLTSTAEGAPLTLVEAMARGCVPIAYDIPYGPADLVRDGVDGFLVAAGDRAAAADRVARVIRARPDEGERMRRAARDAAARFGDAEVVRRWGDVLAAAAAHRAVERRREPDPLDARLDRLRVRHVRDRLRLVARVDPGASGAPVDGATVTFERRSRGAVVRCDVRPVAGWLVVHLDADRSALLSGPGALRVAVDVRAGARHAELVPAPLHPDRRGLGRRVADRVRRARG